MLIKELYPINQNGDEIVQFLEKKGCWWSNLLFYFM